MVFIISYVGLVGRCWNDEFKFYRVKGRCKRRMKELKEITDLKRFLWVFKDLQKINRKISKIDENDCNGYQDLNGNWDEVTEKKAEKKKVKLLIKASELVKEFDLKVYHQGDPRGNALYLVSEEEFLKGSSCDYMNGIPVY